MDNIARKNFLKAAGGSVLDIAVTRISDISAAQVDELSDGGKSNVFFTNDISVKGLSEIYSADQLRSY